MRNQNILLRQRCRGTHAILLGAMVFSSATACAGRPLVTEDAAVLVDTECEWESFLGRQTAPGVTLGATQIGCGIGRNSQLALGSSRERDASARSSYTILTGKTAFRNADFALPGVAVAYTLQSGGERTDYLNYISAEIKGVLTIPCGNWLFHANAGVLHFHQDRSNRVTWALAAERLAAIGRFDLMGEIYGDNENSPWAQIASRWAAIPGQLFFDASYGIHTRATKSHIATVGMKLAF